MNTNGDFMEVHGYLIMEFDGFHRGNSTGKMFTWELTINNIQQYGFDGMSAANWKIHESPKLQVTKKNTALCGNTAEQSCIYTEYKRCICANKSLRNIETDCVLRMFCIWIVVKEYG